MPRTIFFDVLDQELSRLERERERQDKMMRLDQARTDMMAQQEFSNRLAMQNDAREQQRMRAMLAQQAWQQNMGQNELGLNQSKFDWQRQQSDREFGADQSRLQAYLQQIEAQNRSVDANATAQRFQNEQDILGPQMETFLDQVARSGVNRWGNPDHFAHDPSRFVPAIETQFAGRGQFVPAVAAKVTSGRAERIRKQRAEQAKLQQDQAESNALVGYRDAQTQGELASAEKSRAAAVNPKPNADAIARLMKARSELAKDLADWSFEGSGVPPQQIEWAKRQLINIDTELNKLVQAPVDAQMAKMRALMDSGLDDDAIYEALSHPGDR